MFIIVAILALGVVQLDGAFLGSRLRKSRQLDSQNAALVHSTIREQRSMHSAVQGSKVGMHYEELLFTKQKKLGNRMVSAMEIIHKTAYWGTVTLGSPAQDFKVIFDTGSGNLIIPSTNCDMRGCNSHRKYSSKNSSTSAPVVNERGERSTEISFGTGDITGDYYKDKFCIADHLCTEVHFVAASSQSAEPFSMTPFDGILGLGFRDLSMGDHFNIVDELNANSMLPLGTFAVFLTEDLNSEITFGGYRPEQLASGIVWAEVVRESYWEVSVDDITFNNVETGLCQGGCQVAVDTGTSMLAGPSDLVEELSNRLDAQDDCSNFKSLPRIGFKLNNKVLNLSPEDYMDHSPGDCSFSIMSLDVPPPKGPLFIFGDPFLRRFVTIYDRGSGSGARVGFAVAKHGDVDAAQAANIISELDGDVFAVAMPPALVKNEPVEPVKNPLVVRLDAGMMSVPTTTTTVVTTTTAPMTTPAPVVPTITLRADTKTEDIELSPMGQHLANAISSVAKDNALSKGRHADSLVQRDSHGGRGHRSNEKLISIRLHRSGGMSKSFR